MMGAISSITDGISAALGTDGSGGGLLNEPIIKDVALPVAGAYFGAPLVGSALGLGTVGTTLAGSALGGLTSSALGGNPLTGALAGAGGAYFGLPSGTAAGTTAATGPLSGAAWNNAGTAAGTTAATAAGTGSLSSMLGGSSALPLLGAVAGGLSSGGQTTTTSQDKTPWAPAQPWILQNIAAGQNLQNMYRANPISNDQLAAYRQRANDAANFRNVQNSLLQQMSNRQGFSRANPRAQPTRLNFAPTQPKPSNLSSLIGGLFGG